MYKKAFELSYKNKKVEIEIQDFTGTVRNINGTEDLFSLSYISDSKDKGQSILVTEADINFYADDYFNIDELKTVGETDIKVKYYEDGALLWSGFVIPDFFSTSVDITPVVSMVATDRIGTLKEISNNAESNIPIQILASCLKQTGQDLPINLIIDNNHFETPIQSERIEEIASYDVIRTFMVLFNCKVVLFRNAWWVVNKKLLESGFVNYKSYNSNGVGGSVTPFTQPILDIDLVDRDGQREIKPTASEISLFLEFGGSKKYPSNRDFNEWSSNKLNNWTAYNGFIQNKNSKIPLSYDSNYSLIYGQDTNINSLLSRNPFFSTLTNNNYINSPHIRSEEVPMQFIKGVSEVSFKIDFSSINDDRFAIYAVLLIKIPNRNPIYHDYVAIGHDGNIVKAGTTNIDLTNVPVMRIQPAFDENQDRLTAIRTTIESKFKISASDDLDLARSSNAKIQIILFGTEYNDGANTSLIDVVLHSSEISFNDFETTGKGLIFKIKQGGDKFSKSREPETILFSDKINQGVNGHFYNYKYDDTSIVDLPGEFALSSVRERADMFSKARDYYSLNGNFIVNPLAKYVCGSKSFVLIGGQNRREDAGIIVEEIVSNTLNRTDFIYTYFDDGKDKVKTIGTASGGSSSGGGGGSSPSTPQLIKVDEEGNYYSEQPFYSLGGLSAYGFSEVGDDTGGGGIIDVIDNLTSTSKTDPLSANMGRYLKTLIDNIEVGEGGQVIVDWEAITGKPTTFAPSAHSHIIGDVTGLQSALDGKASLTQLDGKEDAFTKNTAFNKNFGTGLNDVARGNHTHTFASLTSKPTTLGGYGITDAYTKTNVNDLLSNKADKVTKITAGTGLTGGGTLASDRTLSVNFGATAGTVAQGNDSRILNGQTAFGWGNHSGKYLSLTTSRPSLDLDTVRTSGVYGGGNTDNRPSSSYSYSPFMVLQSSGDRFVQLWLDSWGGNNIYYRGGSTEVWDDWKTLWHSGNHRSNSENDTRYKAPFDAFKTTFDTMFRKTPTNEIEAKLSLYTLGGLSAYGFSDEGSSGGGGGIVNILSDWAIYDASKSGWALSAGLGVDLNTRKADKIWVESLLEDYVPTDTTYTAGRGLTLTGTVFSTSFDIADYATVTALNSKLATSIFNTHNNDNVRHITGSERAKWNGVVTDFAGLGIGGRNLLIGTSEEWKSQTAGGYNIYPHGGGSTTPTITDVEEGESYVFSARVISNNQRVRLHVRFFNETGSAVDNIYSEFIDSEEEGRLYLAFTVPENAVSFFIAIRREFNSGSTIVDYKKTKLEKGTISTDWSPAPEDQVSDWLTTDVNSFSFIKNKPTKLSQFSNVETAFINKTQSDSWYASLTNFNSHVNNKSNPHEVTKAQVGLGNVTNESKLTMFTNPIFTGTTKVTILELDSNWKVLKRGNELEFQYNNVKKATLTPNGDLIVMGGMTAYQ